MLNGAKCSNQWAWFVLCCALLVLLPVSAEEVITNPWKVWKQAKDLKVSYRNSQWDKLIEVKAEARVRSSLSGFLLFILDTDNTHNWLYNAVSTQVIHQLSPYENVFITTLKSFGPVKARDMVVRSEFWQNDDLSVEIQNRDASAEALQQAQTVRMSMKSARWLIRPNADQTITINYRFVVDAKGRLPSWLGQPIALNGIWKTMTNLSRQLPESAWQCYIYSGITELGIRN